MFKIHKDNISYYLYFLIISLYFAFNLLTVKDYPGDHVWLKEQFAIYNGNIFEFAYDRYLVWSGRFLLEAAMILFSGVNYLFYFVAFISCFLFLLFIFKITKREPYSEIVVFIFPIIFLLYFPPIIFTSAGLIATFTTYFIPITSLIIAYVLKDKREIWAGIISLVMLVLALMHEQLTFISLLLSLYFIANDFFQQRKISVKDLIFFILTIISMLNIKFSPGNINRTIMEPKTWFPNFFDTSLLDKINLAFLESNRIIFTEGYSFIIIFILSCAFLSYLLGRKKLCFSNIALLVMILFQKDKSINLFMLVNQPGYTRWNNTDYFLNYDYNFFLLMVIYLLCLFIVINTLYQLFKDTSFRWKIVGLALIGYGSRMLMALSPTLYASGDRTFLPFIACIFIINVIILNRIINIINNKLDTNATI